MVDGGWGKWGRGRGLNLKKIATITIREKYVDKDLIRTNITQFRMINQPMRLIPNMMRFSKKKSGACTLFKGPIEICKRHLLIVTSSYHG